MILNVLEFLPLNSDVPLRHNFLDLQRLSLHMNLQTPAIFLHQYIQFVVVCSHLHRKDLLEPSAEKLFLAKLQGALSHDQSCLFGFFKLSFLRRMSSCFLSLRASQRCGHCVRLVACRPQCLLEGLSCGFSHTPNTNSLAHINTQMHAHVMSLSFCLFQLFSHTHPPLSTSISWRPSVSFFCSVISPPLLSVLISSCVIWQMNIL